MSRQPIPQQRQPEAATNSFGVYRALEPEFAQELRPVLRGAAQEATHMLRQEYPGSLGHLMIHHQMGVTYIARWQMTAGIANATWGNEWNADDAIRMFWKELDENASQQSVEAPLEVLGWFAARNTKLGGIFRRSVVRSVFHNDSQAVKRWWMGVCPDHRIVPVRTPDHCSFGSYLKRRLTVSDRRAVEQVVARHLKRAKITSVVLGPIIAGETYNLPKTI